MLTKTKMIDVINYHSFGVAIKTKDNSYWVDRMKNGVPTRLPLLLEEIRYINTTSEAFRAGLLFFDEDIEEHMYENELRIPNWKSILKPYEIEHIIKNPTLEGLEKILNVSNIMTFDIIRGIFISLKNKNADISTRVETIINERYKELLNKIYNTRIVLKPKDVVHNASVEDVKALRAQNEAMQKQLQEMQEMMAKMLAKQNNGDVDKKEIKTTKTTKKEGKKTGSKSTTKSNKK